MVLNGLADRVTIVIYITFLLVWVLPMLGLLCNKVMDKELATLTDRLLKPLHSWVTASCCLAGAVRFMMWLIEGV